MLKLWLAKYRPSAPRSYTWTTTVKDMEEILATPGLRKAFLGGIGVRIRNFGPEMADVAPQAREFRNFLRAYHRGDCPHVSQRSLLLAGAALLYLIRRTQPRDYLFGRDNPKKVFRYVWAEAELDMRIRRQVAA